MTFLEAWRRRKLQNESWAEFHKKYHSNGFHYSASNQKILQQQKRSVISSRKGTLTAAAGSNPTSERWMNMILNKTGTPTNGSSAATVQGEIKRQASRRGMWSKQASTKNLTL